MKYAIKDVHEFLKKNAAEFIDSNNDDGVARHLKMYSIKSYLTFLISYFYRPSAWETSLGSDPPKSFPVSGSTIMAQTEPIMLSQLSAGSTL